MLINEINNYPKIINYDKSFAILNIKKLADKNFLAALKSINKNSTTKNKFLWHGWRKNMPEIFQSESVKYREPRGTSLKNQQLVDTGLQKLGFTALRSNSLYCIGSFDLANQFIKENLEVPHAIFPLEGYEFTWVSKPIIGIYGSKSNWWKMSLFAEDALNDKIFKNLGFSNKNIGLAINSQTEILIKGKFISVSKNVLIDLLPQLLK